MVSFGGHWKYPVGYVLVDKVNADDLKCLLYRILDLCAENILNVCCITMDGTAVNCSSMKLPGCKLGDSLEEIHGGFTRNGYDYKLYFILDLKLTRNALGEVKK